MPPSFFRLVCELDAHRFVDGVEVFCQLILFIYLKGVIDARSWVSCLVEHVHGLFLQILHEHVLYNH